jgi:hypothetical protein
LHSSAWAAGRTLSFIPQRYSSPSELGPRHYSPRAKKISRLKKVHLSRLSDQLDQFRSQLRLQKLQAAVWRSRGSTAPLPLRSLMFATQKLSNKSMKAATRIRAATLANIDLSLWSIRFLLPVCARRGLLVEHLLHVADFTLHLPACFFHRAAIAHRPSTSAGAQTRRPAPMTITSRISASKARLWCDHNSVLKSSATAEDENQDKRARYGNNQRPDAPEAVGEECEHYP